MKYLIIILFSININAQTIKINKIKQKGYFWCWAASLSSISKYYHKNISQEYIIQKMYPKLYKTIDNNSPFFSWKPNDYKFQYIKENYQDKLVDEIIPKIGLKAKIISKDKINQYIDKKIPVLVGYDSHIQVIIGYNKKEFIMMNPEHGSINKVNKNYINYRYRNDFFWDPIYIAINI